MFDSERYMKITDFGISEDICTQNSHQDIGTIGYIAPEVAKGQNHGPAADFFALGVIMYEFILGERPFKSCERNDLIKEMEEREIKIEDQDKAKFSKVSVSFANKLLKNDPK